MSALTNEQQQQQAPTAELYTFNYCGSSYRYTSHQQSLKNNAGFEYIAVPIKRSKFQIEENAPISNMTISIVFNGTIFESLRNTNNMPIDMYISKCLLSNIDDSYKIFAGRIINIQYLRQECCLDVVSGGYELERKIPTVYVQEKCNNMLFDPTCSLNKTNYEIQARITNTTVYLQSDYGRSCGIELQNYVNDSFGNGITDHIYTYFIGGYIKNNNEYADILFCEPWNAPSLFRTRWHPGSNFNVGETVSVFPACDRTPTTCKNTFDNLKNFVGMPYLPCLNPVLYGIKEIGT
ncbi:MAG: DUF2163 domain-containing protein [Gammaproteobacteria bacterium]|nr:DUF2163 domain-containing protein [Gammaproteobacteria bacterium]